MKFEEVFSKLGVLTTSHWMVEVAVDIIHGTSKERSVSVKVRSSRKPLELVNSQPKGTLANVPNEKAYLERNHYLGQVKSAKHQGRALVRTLGHKN